jgi:hypothetical protein
MFPTDFVVSGTCKANLHGTCEAFYRPDMVSTIFFFFQLCLVILSFQESRGAF